MAKLSVCSITATHSTEFFSREYCVKKVTLTSHSMIHNAANWFLLQKLPVYRLFRRLSYVFSTDFNIYTFPPVPVSVHQFSTNHPCKQQKPQCDLTYQRVTEGLDLTAQHHKRYNLLLKSQMIGKHSQSCHHNPATWSSLSEHSQGLL